MVQYAIRNGIILSQPMTVGGRKMVAEYGIADTRFFGTKIYQTNLQEFSFSLGTRRSEGDRVGAEQWPLRTVGHHAGHAVDHTQGHQAFIGKRLDVRPQCGEVVRVTNRQHGDPGAAGFLDQQAAGRRQGRLGETAASVDSHETRSRVFNLRHCLAVDPTAGQRRQITGNPKYAVAVGAVALGAGAVVGQHLGDVARGAVALEDLLQQQRQVGERDGGHFRLGGSGLGHAEAPIELFL